MVAQLDPPEVQEHPMVAALATAREALASVRELQPCYLTAAQQEAVIVEASKLEAAAVALRLRVVAVAGAAAEAAGARDVGSWLSHLTNADSGPGHADATLARALDRDWVQVAHGLADGVVSPAHARVITDALDALPADLDRSLVTQAEAQLVAWAAQFRPTEVRRLGRHILDVVAPDVADAEEAKRLEAEERRAREKSSLRVKRLGDGTTRTTILQPDAEADRLLTYLDAFTSPRHEAAEGACRDQDADRIPMHRKRGHAFGALLERLDPAKLPVHGGDATTVLITVSLEALTTQLATAGIIDGDLEHGANLTASQARRLACTAKIIPAVMGGAGEILDLGRARRLFSPAQRKALRLRDRRCRAESCTIPATWTEAHHLRPWSEGGATDLDNAISLCSFHHHRIHDSRFGSDRLPNGDLRFHRRT